MRYIKFEGGTRYCGTDFESYEAYEEIEDSVLDEIAIDLAQDNAESYEYLETGWDEDFEDEEDRENYYADAYCNWTEITEEEYKEHVECD